MSKLDENLWHRDESARAFWDQYQARPYQELLEDTLCWAHPEAGEHWLDIGCGGGQLSGGLYRASGGTLGSIVAMDCAAANVEAIDKLRDKLGIGDQPERITFQCSRTQFLGHFLEIHLAAKAMAPTRPIAGQHLGNAKGRNLAKSRSPQRALSLFAN